MTGWAAVSFGAMLWAKLPQEILWLGLFALLISSLGFVRVVYFVSIGYAFSIAAMALSMLYFFWNLWHPLLWLQCVGLCLYGLRLGTYLVRRESQPSFAKELEDTRQRTAGMKLYVKCLIWLSVSLLYVLMFLPSLLGFASARTGQLPNTSWWMILGLVVMWGGLLMETLADRQKSTFKQKHPHDFCNVGLYRTVRCPNYLGEILFWTGSWIVGWSAYHHVTHWLLTLIGLVCIVLIMMGSTKRLEHKQDERYGDREDYQTYIRTVPVLFPFVPIYSLKHIRVYLE